MRPGSPEASLSLLSAATAERRGARRAEGADLGHRADWELLRANLSRRRLLPQLGPRILDICESCAPASFVDAVERSVAQTRRQAALLQLVSERLIAALAGARIPSMMLKGAALGEAIYGDAGVRPAGDIDLLVAASDLPAAVEVVRQSGYGPAIGRIGADGLPLLHLLLCHERGRQPPVELHWRIHWYEEAFAADMLARGVGDPRRGRRPEPVDELASLLLFYARDGFADLRLATDLGAWWDLYRSRLPGDGLAEVLSRYPQLARALLAAAAVADAVVGIPAERLVGSSRPLGARVRLAARLAEPHPGSSAPQLSADVSLVDWLLTPPGGQRAFASRQLLAPAWMYELGGAEGTSHWRRRAMHCLRVLARFGLRLGGLLGRSIYRSVLDHRKPRRWRRQRGIRAKHPLPIAVLREAGTREQVGAGVVASGGHITADRPLAR